MDERLDWIWLSLLFNPGSNGPKRVLETVGSPKAFREMEPEERRKLGFLRKQTLEGAERLSLARAELIADRCRELGIRIVTMGDPEYPERLKSIYGPPAVLYTLGELSGLDEEAVLAVVGTRNETDYSNSVTGWLCKGLAEAGAVVVSGCALGCDTSAMVGALQGGGRVIGVLGCGMDVDYPKGSGKLKRRILRQGGALITELPPESPVRGKYFPTRNRILAGLSIGVLVTQAPQRSGALITADHALENGRDVFCVPPYSIFDPAYYGVVEYLRQGAIPVFSPDDVIGQYTGQFPEKLDPSRISGDYVKQKREDGRQERISRPKPEPAPPEPPPVRTREELDQLNREAVAGFDETQRLVYTNLEPEPCYVNELAERTGLGIGRVLSVLTELELEGVAESVGGSRYRLTGRKG